MTKKVDVKVKDEPKVQAKADPKVTPFDDETKTAPTVVAPGDAVADYVDINNPDHANLTYDELQALAKNSKKKGK